MFERYTEGARRTVFFARYEASNFGSLCIDTEHLLLGLLRADKLLFRHVQLKVDFDAAHEEVVARIKPGAKTILTNVDLPLSEHAGRALTYASEDANRLNHRHIGTTHLLLGLMRDEKFASAESLAQLGAHLGSLRTKVEALGEHPLAAVRPAIAYHRTVTGPDVIAIHGTKRNEEELHKDVSKLRELYWERKQWKPRNLVIRKDGNRFSFDLTLAKKSSEFELVKGGWKKDQCAI